jgi:hypothetical protein
MKKIGIFLDHSTAQFINPVNSRIILEIKNLSSGHERVPGESSIGMKVGHTYSSNNEYSHHHQEQQSLHKYYNAIAQAIQSYDDVFILGPTTAPVELLNFLRKGKKEPIAISIEKSDYLSPNQLIAHVKDHFK